jgi:ATP-grasp domain, R2K clade family 3
MLVVLCRDPLDSNRPDRSFEAELAAIERLGLRFVLVDHDALVRGDDAARVVRRVPVQAKHEWSDACFITSALDRSAVQRVVSRFLELQGDDLAGGLVFREFIEFRPIGVHPRSQMPLTEEYRIFWLDGSPLFSSPYWKEGEYASTELPIEQFAETASAVRSRFFTMDLARRLDGEWMIIELGDGQVSGLPREGDGDAFYEALSRQ